MAKRKRASRRFWGWGALAAGIVLVPIGLATLACGTALAAIIYMLWFAPMRCRVEIRPNNPGYRDDPYCRRTAYGLLNGCRQTPGHGQQKRDLLLRGKPMPWWLWRSNRAWAAIVGVVLALAEIGWAGVALLT